MELIVRSVLITCILFSQMPLSFSTTIFSKLADKTTLPLQPYLATLASTEPDERVTIIVQKKSDSDQAEQFVRQAGGTVRRELPFMHAFSAEITARAVTEVAALTSVQWVSLDAPMISTSANDGSQPNLRDDFSQPVYNGSDGGKPWKSEWQEIGEADGALLGDVAITDFWGGALQGMRLMGSGKGIWRAIELAGATQATVTIAYRRKGFLAGDSVSLQVSGDGVSWTELVQLNGPVTDAEIEYATYDISQWSSGQSVVRLLNSPAQSSSARFYLDFIEIQSIQTSGVDETDLSNKLYLPVISGGSAEQANSQHEISANSGLPRRVKADNSVVAAGYLQSSYISSIRADAVWNSFPALAGTGIGVAVVDSGIRDHVDFWDDYGNYRLSKLAQFASDSNTPDDYYGHGTHIGGIIGGDGWLSNYAYPGVAHRANLIDVKITNDYGFGNMSDAVAGLQWIYNNRTAYNIKVVNLSLNSSVPEPYQTSPLNAALEILWFNKIVVVVSAGNKGSQQLFPPANDPFLITVGAADDKGTTSTSDDVVAAYSAFGVTEQGFAKPDIVAPGSNIVNLLASDDSNLLIDYPNNLVTAPNGTRYFKMSGTSMAAAVVSGAVALLVQDEPNLTPDQIKYRLRATARPIANQSGCAAGSGMLDIYAAVTGSTTQSANTNLQASQLLWTGSTPLNWSSVNWNSVNWNSVNWNSVNWNSVNWNSFNRNSVNWNSTDTGSSTTASNCSAAINKLTLVNASTDQDAQAIYDNAMVYIRRIGSDSLSIRADTWGAVESVKFELNGVVTKIDNAPPYALRDNLNADYYGYTFIPGVYTLKVTAYPQDNGMGTALVTQQIKFSVVSSNNCELEGKVRSITSANRVPMKVVNNFGTQVNLLWLDYSGLRVPYVTALAPGQSWINGSFATHPWMIVRSSDNACLYLASDVATDPIVTNPQQVDLVIAHSGKCVALPVGTGFIQQSACNGSLWQKWEQVPADGGFMLRNRYTGKCLDVSSASTAVGASVSQYDCIKSANQILNWSGTSLKFKHSNLCLDVYGASTADGTSIVQWTCTGSLHQSFKMR